MDTIIYTALVGARLYPKSFTYILIQSSKDYSTSIINFILSMRGRQRKSK